MATGESIYSQVVYFPSEDHAQRPPSSVPLGRNELHTLLNLKPENPLQEDSDKEVLFRGALPGSTGPFRVPATLDACMQIALLVFRAEGAAGWQQVLERSKTTRRDADWSDFKVTYVETEERTLQNALLNDIQRRFDQYADYTNRRIQAAAVRHAQAILTQEAELIERTWRRYFDNSRRDLVAEDFDLDALEVRDPLLMAKLGAQAKECADLEQLLFYQLGLPGYDPGKDGELQQHVTRNQADLRTALMAYGEDHPIVHRLYKELDLPKSERVIYHPSAALGLKIAAQVATILREGLAANAALQQDLTTKPKIVWSYKQLISRSCRLGIDGALMVPERSFAYQAALAKAGLPPRMTQIEIAQVIQTGVAAIFAMFVLTRVIAASNPVGWVIYLIDLVLAVLRITEIREEMEQRERAYKAVLRANNSIARAPDWTSAFFEMVLESASVVK